MTRLEDSIFSLRGFLILMVPALLTQYLVVLAAVYFALDGKLNANALGFVAIAPTIMLTVPALRRYRSALGSHNDLLTVYGDTYRRLISTGDVSIGFMDIMYGRSPERYQDIVHGAHTPKAEV